ncbi:MAG: MOSC domain-containing protein [Pirellulaceae bacterium]|jgi:hypothetical protein|nr:MOSC domain-containing protein [Pirellulaceae bacterium]
MHLSGLYIYPIKGTAAIALQQAEVRRRGLAGDRRWAVVGPDGQFLSQRTHRRLAAVSASLGADGSLRLQAPDLPDLEVSVPAGDSRMQVTVWNDTFEAACADPAASRWFAEHLGSDCRLVFMDAASHRAITHRRGQPGDVVSFADAMPLLLTTDASLEDLNRRLTHAVPMSRFRPNVTIGGSAPWEEDRWQSVRIGAVEFEITHPCARCVVTTIDQQTGESNADGEPLKTLAAFRRQAGKVLFGQNLKPCGTGTISIGDPVTACSQ